MNHTTIEWVRNPDGTQGFTLNIETGCLNGCSYCWARALANTRLKHVMLANAEVAPGCDPADPFAPRFWPKRLAELHQVKGWERGRTMTIARFEQKPRGIFLCDMGDLFGRCVPHEWTEQVMEAIAGCPQHRFYLLTKQPQELAKWSPFPPNAWVGVSAWDHASFINACHYLEAVQATVKYVSLEPLLDWILELDIGGFCTAAGVSWVVVGAQTKPSVLPNWKWVEDICRRCEGAGIAVFLKNILHYLVEDEHWKFELLQEFPKVVQP